MLKHNINTFNASKISWTGKEGFVEASSLGLKAGVLPYCPLYDDACDVGLKLVNSKKGTECLFVLERVMDNNDDDIVYWKFVSVDGKIGLTIFND
jgi:hypothetical protein